MTVGGACLVEVVLFKCCRVSVLVVVFLWLIVTTVLDLLFTHADDSLGVGRVFGCVCVCN